MADYLNIAGRVRTTASDGVAMEAQEVKDLNLNKSQQEVNADVQTELGDRYTKEETYSKEQLNNLITTPDVNYVSVVATDATTAVTDILPATGEANTIYRVGNWDGTQYDPTMYALYAWNGSSYVCLAVRSFVGEIYDVSVNHPDGQGNPTPYADLAAALGTSGANIPADIRRGGMSIKFIQGTVQSSDNKYVQYRLMSATFSTTPSDWQGVDDEPTAGSDNLIKSGGTYLLNQRINTNLIKIDKLDYPSKEYLFRSNNTTLVPCALEAGEYIFKNNSAIVLKVTLVDAEENTIVIIGGGNGIQSGATKAFTLPSDCIFAKIWVSNSSGTSISLAFTISIDNNLEKRVSQNTESIAENANDISTITKKAFGAFANDITDFSSYDTYPVIIRNNKTWLSGDNESTVIPVIGGTKIKLYASLNRWTYATFLKSLKNIAITAGYADADVCDSDEYNDGYRLSILQGEVLELDVPNDCNFFVIQTKFGETDITPSKVCSISGEFYDLSNNVSDIGKSFNTEDVVTADETLIANIVNLTIGADGYSQAIDVSGYDKCKLAFTTATFAGGGYSALGYIEFDENNNILESVLPNISNIGGLYFIKSDGTTSNNVDISNFPNGGYCYINLHKDASHIKIRAFVNSQSTVLYDRVPTGWSFYGYKTMFPLHKESITGSGVSVDDLLGNEEVVFEQGSISFATGTDASSNNYIRTGFLEVDDYQYVRCESNYTLRVFYYDESKTFISKGDSSMIKQIYELKYTGAKYFRLSVNHTNITPSCSFYFHITKRLSKDVFEEIYADGIARLGSLFMDNGAFKFLDTTDMHGDLTSLDLCHDIQKLNGDDVKIICTGDVVYGTPRVNNIDDGALTKFVQKMQEYGVYFCAGQHEVGFQNLGAGFDGKLKSNCLTHQEVFEYFIEPMKSFYGLPQDYDKIWYKVDFGSASKIILISLYEWNIPLDTDPNDSTKYKYIRSSMWFGQEQIDWFINTLNSIPQGYSAIVLLHRVESDIVKFTDNPFFGPRATGGGALTEGLPIMDIIDAFISRTTINKTYTATHSPDPTHDTTDYSDLSVTAVGDFTNALGSFAFYLTGDCHADSFGKLKDSVNTQPVICLGSPTPMCSSDKKLIGAGQDTFVTGFNLKSYGILRVGRLGNTESWFMQDRSRAVIDLTEVS